jgi:hypothetical protein
MSERIYKLKATVESTVTLTGHSEAEFIDKLSQLSVEDVEWTMPVEIDGSELIQQDNGNLQEGI